jgi:hypothetical protein
MAQPNSDKSQPTTRAKNATQHPGAPVQATKRKRRTKAQIEADNKAAEAAKAAEEAKRKAGLKQIANLEQRINEEDSNDVTPKAKATSRSRPLRRTSSHMHIPLYNDNFSEPLTEQTGGDSAADEYEQPTEREGTDIEATDIDEKESAPPKKKAKQAKGKAREAIKAAGRETMDEVARGQPVDGTSARGKREADHGTSNRKTGFVFPFLSLFLSSMLTLDQSTLFYFSINSTPEPSKKGIKSWASHVDLPIPSRPNSNHGSRGSKPGSQHTSSQHNSSFRTSKSTLVDHIVITTKADDRSASASDNDETFGRFEYEDETAGVERDFAVSSPIKGSGRLTSSVKNI